MNASRGIDNREISTQAIGMLASSIQAMNERQVIWAAFQLVQGRLLPVHIRQHDMATTAGEVTCQVGCQRSFAATALRVGDEHCFHETPPRYLLQKTRYYKNSGDMIVRIIV